MELGVNVQRAPMIQEVLAKLSVKASVTILLMLFGATRNVFVDLASLKLDTCAFAKAYRWVHFVIDALQNKILNTIGKLILANAKGTTFK